MVADSKVLDIGVADEDILWPPRHTGQKSVWDELVAVLSRNGLLSRGQKVGTEDSGHRGHVGAWPRQQGGSAPSVNVPLALMENAELIPTGERTPKGAFESEKVEIRGDGHGIVKPEPGGMARRFWGREGQSFSFNEALAYDAAEAMGFHGLVPRTVARMYKNNTASLQLWIEKSAGTWYDADVAEKDAVPDMEWRKLTLFDYVIGNSDRHGNNVLVKDGKLRAIDHGLAFSATNSYDRVRSPRYQRYQYYPGDLRPVRRLLHNVAFWKKAKDFLPERYLEKLRSRCEEALAKVKARGHFDVSTG